jgi:hypothetical protein
MHGRTRANWKAHSRFFLKVVDVLERAMVLQLRVSDMRIRYKYNHKSANNVHLFKLYVATELIQPDRYVKRRCIS